MNAPTSDEEKTDEAARQTGGGAMTVEDDLRSAAAELRDELAGGREPAFEPRPPLAGRVGAAALVTVAVVAGWLGGARLLADGEDLDATATPPTRDSTVDSTPARATDPSLSGSADPRRVTSAGRGEVIKPVFSGTQAYNADGSVILLYRSGPEGGGHVLFDGATLTEVSPVSIDPSDIEDVFWDRDDPDRLRYVRRDTNQLIELDVRAGTDSVAHRFEGCSSVDLGEASGTTTSGSDLLAVICRRPEGDPTIVSYDLSAGVELARAPAAAPGAPIALVSGSGYLLVTDDEVRALDRRLAPTGPDPLYRGRVSMIVAAADGDGADVAVATLFEDETANGLAIMFDVVTGARTDLVGEATGFGYPATGSHISLAATGSPSIIAAVGRSSAEGSNTEALDARDELASSEILVIDLSRSADPVAVVGPHNMGSREPFGPWGPVQVAPSPDGSQVLFSSDWGGGVTIDTYLIDVAR